MIPRVPSTTSLSGRWTASSRSIFFFQAEDGIRDRTVTEFRRVLFRSLGFIAAVAFATILAVVAGLTLAGATALSHDVFVHAIRRGHATEQEQMRVARAATLIFGVEIGRASCRERVEVAVGGAGWGEES